MKKYLLLEQKKNIIAVFTRKGNYTLYKIYIELESIIILFILHRVNK